MTCIFQEVSCCYVSFYINFVHNTAVSYTIYHKTLNFNSHKLFWSHKSYDVIQKIYVVIFYDSHFWKPAFTKVFLSGFSKVVISWDRVADQKSWTITQFQIVWIKHQSSVLRVIKNTVSEAYS